MVIIFKVATEICLNVEALALLDFPRSMAFGMMLYVTERRNHKVFGKREKVLEWLGKR